MKCSSDHGVVAAVIALAVVVAGIGAPQRAEAVEIALAQGTIAIHEAAAGMRSPSCSELVVEARDGLDNHLIALTQPQTDANGNCHYAVSVPAQSAVYLHARPALVAAERWDPASGTASVAPTSGRHVVGRGVQIRWSVITPTTYFFAPGEQKTVQLSY